MIGDRLSKAEAYRRAKALFGPTAFVWDTKNKDPRIRKVVGVMVEKDEDTLEARTAGMGRTWDDALAQAEEFMTLITKEKEAAK